MLPVFLLMLFGLIDGARYVFVSNALSNAAREGARKASVEASWKQWSAVAVLGSVARIAGFGSKFAVRERSG